MAEGLAARRGRRAGTRSPARAGLHYAPGFVTPGERAAITRWLARIHPIWEERFSARAARAAGGQRRLLRPVYWLGAWQFACLDYYAPPRRTADCCVRAEPYPPALAGLTRRIERRARRVLARDALPPNWKLNTCLVNLYGAQREPGGKRIDRARVGEHRDHEPGPVASISLGERALFQFVRRGGRERSTRVVRALYLEDRSLLLFAGAHWKRDTLHRVLRVERRAGERFAVRPEGFETRRVNLTFRYVPEEHIVRYANLDARAREDVRRYVEELARHSRFFEAERAAAVSGSTGCTPGSR